MTSNTTIQCCLSSSYCCWICPTTIKTNLKLMPYFTRLIILDRVGFDPTTSVSLAAFYGSRSYHQGQQGLKEHIIVQTNPPLPLFELLKVIFIQSIQIPGTATFLKRCGDPVALSG